MSVYKLFIKELFIDSAKEMAYFPIWWYTAGLKKFALYCLAKISAGWRASGTGIILRNFFKPMYGTEGWDAVALSMFSHALQSGWRLFLIGLWAVLWLGLILVWAILPISIIWNLT